MKNKHVSKILRARIRIRRVLTSAVMIFCTLCLCTLTLSGCGQSERAEVPDGFYGRAVELIEGAAEVNQLLFGAGVPVYAYGSPEAEWQGIYGNQSADQVVYLLVTEESSYFVTDQIRIAAEAVYSSAYLETILSMLFDGYAEGSGVLIPDYADGARGLMMAATRTARSLERRLYDYASMRVLPPVTDSRITVSVDSFLASSPDERLAVKLTFVCENGVWLLDTPTY